MAILIPRSNLAVWSLSYMDGGGVPLMELVTGSDGLAGAALQVTSLAGSPIMYVIGQFSTPVDLRTFTSIKLLTQGLGASINATVRFESVGITSDHITIATSPIGTWAETTILPSDVTSPNPSFNIATVSRINITVWTSGLAIPIVVDNVEGVEPPVNVFNLRVSSTPISSVPVTIDGNLVGNTPYSLSVNGGASVSIGVQAVVGGYRFDHWELLQTPVGNANPYTTPAFTADVEYVAVYVPILYRVTLRSIPTGVTYISPAGTTEFYVDVPSSNLAVQVPNSIEVT